MKLSNKHLTLKKKIIINFLQFGLLFLICRDKGYLKFEKFKKGSVC